MKFGREIIQYGKGGLSHVAPGFLHNPDVRRWLRGVEPAWTLLTFESMNALQQAPSKENRALSLADDLTEAEITASAVARNTLILLRRAAECGGLKLTPTGNLPAAVIAEMIELFEWPGFDRAKAFWLKQDINEPDFLPLFFVRREAQIAKLVRPCRGNLIATRLGQDMLNVGRQRALQAILFHVTFWHDDLSYLGRGIHGSWPQGGVGMPLWSLCATATYWHTSVQLTRLCAIPAKDVLEASWDTGSLMMEARILRPLVWYGLLECRAETRLGVGQGQEHFYRKAPLFDRFLSFDVRTESPQTARH